MIYAISAVATFLSSIFVSLFTFLIGQFSKRLLIFTAVMSALAVALSSLLTQVGTLIQGLISNLALAPFVPMFAPSNLPECISIIVVVKFSGTLYNFTRNFLENKLVVS